MNTICADKKLALDSFAGVQCRTNASLILLIGNNFSAKTDCFRTACDQCIVESLDQVSPVDMEIVSAPAIDRRLAERDVEQPTTAAAHPHFQSLGTERILENAGGYSQLIEHLHAIGAELDTRADFIQHAGLFENENLVSKMIERQSGGQAPNASACYQDAHSDTSHIIRPQSSRP
jgi:hypothetical protein